MSIDNRRSGDVADEDLRQLLGDFKASVHAWSEAAYSRPRSVQATRRRSLGLAAGWALGCVLVAGSVSGGVYEHLHRQSLASAAAAQQVRQRLAAQAQMREENANLLATVDSDISREVPSAMEPLAQLMDEDANR